MNNRAIIQPGLRYRAQHLCETMIRVSGQDPTEETRRRPVVTARVFVSYALMLEGWSEHQIGSVLGWDHSTINHYRGRFKDIMVSPGYDAERQLWEQFKNAI